MAIIKTRVFMGFEDELITQKYQSLLNYTANKVGGKPDWIDNKPIANPVCQFCGLTLPLIVQIYAPLEKSPYHRTLYLFGCINPNCWNQKESWVCLRSQFLDVTVTESETCEKTLKTFDWCEGANDWEDEENGNIVREMRNEQDFFDENIHLSSRMAALDFDDCIEEVSSAGAMGHPVSPTATAEIEGDEDEVVTIDSPCTAQVDVTALLDRVNPVPQVPSETLQFVSFFISVSEEDHTKLSSPVNVEFNVQMMTVDEESNSLMNKKLVGIETNHDESTETYEKAVPVHGDKLFHHFISRLQRNPGQLLRYIRDGGLPLFLYPAKGVPNRCQHCHGELVYELQLLPTLISRLQLVGSGTGHIEFGTVFVLACQRSCWSSEDTVRSEYVLVQREM